MPVVGHEVIDPLYYERYGYPHATWTFLREHDPVARFEPPGMRPFWAITRYADVSAISREPKRWKIAPRIAVFPDVHIDADRPPFRHLLNMDPPEHGKYRNLLSLRFTPKTLEPKRAAIGGIVDEALARLATRREADFVEDFSATIPLAVIAEMIGLPREDWKLMFDLSNAIIASEDPDFQHGATTRETIEGAVQTSFDYFRRMVEARRRSPRDDLASGLATAEVMGEPIAEWELLSYFVLLMVAGNETTRNATSGGLLALIEHRSELEKLRAAPSLIPAAVEEIVRWVSPVIQFCRTAEEDVEVAGTTIRAGEAACLFYPSANRDERVFPDPFAFRVDREPNEHLAFGIGVHFCLGANLARLELQEIFRRLVPRLDDVELAGPVERMRSSFVGGIKRMPIRYRLRG
ncbi:MAG TPA: cytochrome P450 [Candidatus Binatia bacterium]|nr:cytochrome P450 [Candidatus Binatia bacterium]